MERLRYLWLQMAQKWEALGKRPLVGISSIGPIQSICEVPVIFQFQSEFLGAFAYKHL